VSLYGYRASLGLSAADEPFDALIMAAMRKADTGNAGRLRGAFPGIWRELEARYNAPGGKLPSDEPKPASDPAWPPS